VTETLKGKTYELTCAIGKTGNADAEFGAEVVNDIDQATENIKYWVWDEDILAKCKNFHARSILIILTLLEPDYSFTRLQHVYSRNFMIQQPNKQFKSLQTHLQMTDSALK